MEIHSGRDRDHLPRRPVCGKLSHFSSGDYTDQFIASLLLYLLFVVSVLGLQILRKLNGRQGSGPPGDRTEH